MGTLYPGLMRLEAKGWISAKWANTPSNRKARFYELTARGRKQLESEKAEWAQMAGIIAKVLEMKSNA